MAPLVVCRPADSHSNFDAFLLTGQSGLGKSTLMNTLFKSKVSRKSVLATAQEKIPKTIEIKSISHGMELFNLSVCSLVPPLYSVYLLHVKLLQTFTVVYNPSYIHSFLSLFVHLTIFTFLEFQIS